MSELDIGCWCLIPCMHFSASLWKTKLKLAYFGEKEISEIDAAEKPSVSSGKIMYCGKKYTWISKIFVLEISYLCTNFSKYSHKELWKHVKCTWLLWAQTKSGLLLDAVLKIPFRTWAAHTLVEGPSLRLGSTRDCSFLLLHTLEGSSWWLKKLSAEPGAVA